MENFLYSITGLIAQIHSYILGLNNNMESSFTDKELHFIVMGGLGLLLIFIIYPIFKLLVRTGHVMVVAFFYVITVLIGLAFAIEIGQRITGTGVMEFDDIMYGIAGFLAMFVVFLIIRGIFHLIRNAIRKDEDEWYS